MGGPAPTNKFAGFEVTLIETQRKAVNNSPYLLEQHARNLED
jgi:hypothetical protein